jgi:hypothetical protein
MSAVVFDPAAFKARYPEFAAVADPTLAACFDEAGLYLSNTDNSPVQNLTRRATLLNMLTAHEKGWSAATFEDFCKAEVENYRKYNML